MDSSRQRPKYFWLVCSEHAHVSYPGLSCPPPEFSPIGGGKKGEFRDWTKEHVTSGLTHLDYFTSVNLTYVPVNSKTAHPLRAIPGHLTRVKLRTVGNLTKMRPARWGIWLSCQDVVSGQKQKDFAILWFSRRVSFTSIPRGFFCCCRFI